MHWTIAMQINILDKRFFMTAIDDFSTKADYIQAAENYCA